MLRLWFFRSPFWQWEPNFGCQLVAPKAPTTDFIAPHWGVPALKDWDSNCSPVAVAMSIGPTPDFALRVQATNSAPDILTRRIVYDVRMRQFHRSAIDLFAGAGGLSLGLKRAGWQVEAAIEFDTHALATHQVNMPEVLHISDDVRTIDFERFWGVDLVAGGPPCQPFSVSGRQRGSGDERDMVPQFVRAVREAKPTCFLMENVHGLATTRFRPYLNSKIAELVSLGYDVHSDVLDAADFGVPQHRRRLFVVGVPKGVPFAFPKPTHGPRRERSYRTVRSALEGLDNETFNRAKVVYCKNPILRRSPYAGMLLNGKGRPLNLDAPSHTIPATAGGNRTHILDPHGVLLEYHRHLRAGGEPRVGVVPDCRRLTVRESAALQTFPPDFFLAGTPSRQYSQIGNAVPVLLAQAVGTALMTSMTSFESLDQMSSQAALL